ncbi:MAG TPA: protein kinase [Bryobacteraceae bacterium]|nr:protein kinase [Bryobacteraceae bacterium]
MPLSAGDKLGPYEILAPIGAGGMGEVYRARDPRLNRNVAIKVSNAEFSERFVHEARSIAALNHPNICTLYDVGPNYLVMEYIEGTPLKGPLPLDQTLKYAAQICDALDAAHKKNITHRDLKPANILVTKAGVKLLDFGLAKMGPAVKAGETTMTMALTSKGEILGTLVYMSPEQVNGEEAGPRSDIFSFGLVLYEMLTGKRVFGGKSQASVIAAILERPAPSVADLAPAALDRVLKRCLEKDPENRWQSARDLKAALEWISTEAPTPAPAPAPARRQRLWQGVAAALAVIAAATAWALWPKPPVRVNSTRFQILLPEKEDYGLWMAFSPDGRKLAFTTRGRQPGIWIRDLEALETRHLAGTENALALFWSPDSRFLGFGGGGRLTKIDVSGGPPQTLCEAAGIGIGSWNRDGVIIFGASAQGPLRRVPASGGVPTDVTAVDRQRGETYHSSPIFLPDGRHFLYLIGGSPEVNGIYVGSLDAKLGQQKHERLLASRLSAGYTPSQNPANGRLFFMRDTTLMAQPFDNGRLQLTGEPVAVAEQLGISGFHGFFSVSPSGALAYRTGAQSAGFQLTWFDRQGKTQGTFGDLRPDQGIALSADGTRAAVRDAPANVNGDIWTLDFARGVRTRLTFHQSFGSFPVGSPDGSRIAFSGNNWETLYEKASSGAGDEKELEKKPGEQKQPDSWSHDGRLLLYHTFNVPQTVDDLWVLPLEGDRKPVLLLGSKFTEREGSCSPDMRWIAYTSNESGRLEVYVRPFLASGASGASGSTGAPSLGEGKWQVSKDGGTLAKWRADGKELIFRAPNGSPMAVDVTATGAAFQAGVPKQLFVLPPNVGDWDVTADGKRFLAAVPPVQQTTQTPITVVLNWQAALQK